MANINHFDHTHYQDPASAKSSNDLWDFVFTQKTDVGCFLVRLTIGGLMLFHGISKIIFGIEPIEGILASAGIPAFFSFGVFIGEVIAPVMLIIGYKVRLAAFVLAINMLIATLLVHASSFNQINELGGWMLELNALYFFGAIAIMFLGAGRISITKGKGALD